MMRFRAPLAMIGINRCVDVPLRVSVALGGTRTVRAIIERTPVHTTVMPRGGGRL